MYSFSKANYPSLKDAAAEAVQRIYESGLAIRDGRIGPGHNNVLADNAANAFTPGDLELLIQSPDPLEQTYCRMIGLRQVYSGLSDGDDPRGKVLLGTMHDIAQQMKTMGWQPRSELVRTIHSSPAQTPPVRDDFNYDRAQLEALGAHWGRFPGPEKKLLP